MPVEIALAPLVRPGTALLPGLVVLALASTSPAAGEPPTQDGPPVSPQSPSQVLTGPLSDYLRDEVPGLLEASREPGLAVVLVEGGRTTLCEGFGLADRESGRPVTADTRFNVGSISKTVTAWVVMHHVDAGELELGAALPELLDELPFGDDERASGVTVERLLSHTAGIGLASVSGYDADGSVPGLREVLADEVAIELEPGTDYRYSGGGYGLLQLVLEERTGHPLARDAKRCVLNPLGMKRSGFELDKDGIRELATPYSVRISDEPGGARVPRRVYPIQAAAGFTTTARDLGRFLEAHMRGPEGEPPGRGVLSPGTLERMGRPCAPATEYGLGYELPRPFGSHAVLMHNGTNLGWMAHFLLLPDLGVGVGILSNSDAGSTVHTVLRRFRDELVARMPQ